MTTISKFCVRQNTWQKDSVVDKKHDDNMKYANI